MRYEINDNTVTFYLDNPRRTEETVRNQSFARTGLTDQQIIPLLDCLLKKYRGQALESQEFVTTGLLRPIFAYFQTTGSAWPTKSIEWQMFVLRFHQFYLTDTYWSVGKLRIRMKFWGTKISGLLESMKVEEIISSDVVIPKFNKKKIRSYAMDQQLLGLPRATPVSIEESPQKLLVDINFGRTDADYLDAVEKKCRQLVTIIREVCQAHWDGLMKDGETGRQLAAQVTDANIVEVIETGPYRVPSQEKGYIKQYYTSPTHPQGPNWALAFFRHSLTNGSKIGCVSMSTLRASRLFPTRLFASHQVTNSYTALDAQTAMLPDQWQLLPLPARFYRFACLLSNLDAAAACCLLTIEHPQFTAESLQSAKLLNVRGKPYLLLTDSSEHSILSIDKPRAGTRKSVVLSVQAQQLIMDILRWTAPVRKVLRNAGDKTWRYLFLGVRQRNNSNGFLGMVEGTCHYLTGMSGTIGLTTLYKALPENGLAIGTFDYRRLRNTMGIIRWFETGSIAEMSRRLGNTRMVALENYLPPALLQAWNTRIIRRFQNTLIVLACHDESYLLDATDFTSIADLQHFIAQLIVDYPVRTSPLADEVQRRLGSDQQRETESLALTPGLLNIQLSPKSLGLLYSFQNLALKNLSPEELNKVDILSGLAPKHFTDMATMLRHAAECEEIHPALSESLSVPFLKQIHGEALAIQFDLDAKFAKFVAKNCWADNQ